MRKAFAGLGILTLFALCTAVVTALPAGAEIERSFDTGANGLLVVDAEGASVDVNTSSSSTVSVLIERKRGDEPIENDYAVEIEETSSGVRVDVEKKRRLWGPNQGLQITVDLPRQYSVDIRTSGGSLEVTDLDGEVKARTSGGSVKMGAIDGEVNVKTSGGSITLQSSSVTADLSTSGGSITAGDVAGSVVAHTSGGSVQIERADGDVDVSTSGGSIRLGQVAGSIDASTSGGSLTAEFTEQPTRDSRLSTSGGTVRVTLADGLGFDLDAQSSNGVSTRVPVEVYGEIKRNRVAGKINGGGPALVLRASGGRIVVDGR